MSREGAPTFSNMAKGAKVAIIASAWHNKIMDQLISGAEAELEKAEVSYEVFRVAGAFEIPLACKVALEKYDAVVALGVVIRGDTPHFDYVCDAVTQGINSVILETKRPIGFGLLTVDTEEQALVRSQNPYEGDNKGVEAAQAVVASLDVLQKLRK
jgi:6,7-dimethyl-8-ribityllumazine synthase